MKISGLFTYLAINSEVFTESEVIGDKSSMASIGI